MSAFSSSNWIMCNIKSLFYLQDILSKKTSIQYSVHSMYDVKCMLTLWFVALYFRPHSRMVVWLMKFCGCLLIVFYFAIPAFIKLYPAIVVDIAFLNMSMYFFCIIFPLQKIFSVFANSGYSILGPRACFIPGGFRALVGPFPPYPPDKAQLLHQDTDGRSRWVLDTLVRAHALDSYGCQGVCCICVWWPSADVPIGSVGLQVLPHWGVKGRGEGSSWTTWGLVWVPSLRSADVLRSMPCARPVPLHPPPRQPPTQRFTVGFALLNKNQACPSRSRSL